MQFGVITAEVLLKNWNNHKLPAIDGVVLRLQQWQSSRRERGSFISSCKDTNYIMIVLNGLSDKARSFYLAEEEEEEDRLPGAHWP